MQIRNNTAIDIKESIGLSYNAYDVSTQRAGVLKNYVRNTRETKKAYFEQYKLGKRTLLDLLSVQNEEYRVETDYLKTLNEQVFNRYRILNSMGILLPFLDENCKKATKKVNPKPKPDASKPKAKPKA